MEKCYEYLDCQQNEFVRREKIEIECWEIEGTLCDTHTDILEELEKELGNRKEFCNLRIYYQQQKKYHNAIR